VRTSQIFQAVTPYVLMSVLLLLAIFFWPAIATWLPSRL
jgi:TRAP-type mannitol/chloroaromatic compound transport system permease large subunit